ncbi:putative U-box domain-containing protein 42 [Cucurbita maxima]|uniref:RING-type E3 ubiquitin transferase n=1 Tax=Cucurbita maxima TaxID=3661 RepID=A0A6J1HVV2_CUCMA|nr:putative U-box domain-containing protein 42 [Cucurbita maxima]XP_022967966.1 putative U-box domain-containing protein 42 [Cucurbita maxima]
MIGNVYSSKGNHMATMKTNPNMSMAELILASISKILDSTTCTEEHGHFIEIGSYFYRASMAIIELQAIDPIRFDEILQSLNKSINLAKDLLEKFLTGIQQASDSEPISIIDPLKELIKQMGECLNKVATYSFEDQNYVKVAILSLSDEMQNISSKIVTAQAVINEQEMRASSSDEQPEVIENDLYPIDMDWDTNNTQSPVESELSEAVKYRNVTAVSTKRPSTANYIEPLFETFICPLTKDIMDDPVSLETGVTYERKAIVQWFEEFEESEEVFCPVTGQKLVSKAFNSNRALKSTIDKWKERNEIATIKVARAALSLASSDKMMLEAIKDLSSISKGKQFNIERIFDFDMLPLLVECLEYRNKDVRYAVLELLHQMAEINEDNKKTICNQLDMSRMVNLLSSGHRSIRNTSLLLLHELSRTQSLTDQIGSVTGGISMLIVMKNDRSDEFASEKADETLRNLEISPTNIKLMAEYGLMEPLVRHLTEGNEWMRIEMASYLGEMVIRQDCMAYVAEKASPALVGMVHEGDTLVRNAAFKALLQISSHRPNGEILAKAGTVQVMAEEIFTRTICDELNDPKTEAAEILANICDSSLDLETLQVNAHGSTMSSDYIVCNIIDLLDISTPDEFSKSLIRILLCLTKSPKTMDTIVSGVKSSEACDTLIEFLNSPDEELGIVAIKLLISLCPYMGFTMAKRLCETSDQVENLISSITWTDQVTERQALSATFLAKLPHQSLTLNTVLVNKNIVSKIMETIDQIPSGGMGMKRYASTLLEGSVGILVRFTSTLHDPQMLFIAKFHNFTSVFTNLLAQTSSDEVQKLSAIGLEKLSSASMSLSKPLDTERKRVIKFLHVPKLLSLGSSKKGQLRVCPVHKGACSSQNTFCLVHAKAIEKLLRCLDNEKEEVAEAALSAICTLVDDKVDVDRSVSLLNEFDTIKHVLNVVRMHKQESLWHKSFWLIEKFLLKGGENSLSNISQDRSLPTILAAASHQGSSETRQIAEKILTHLNMVPNFSAPNYTL